MRLDEAEAAWREAFRLNRYNPEPAWRLPPALRVHRAGREAARELALRLLQGRPGPPRESPGAPGTDSDRRPPAGGRRGDQQTDPGRRREPRRVPIAAGPGEGPGPRRAARGRVDRLRSRSPAPPGDPDASDAILTALEDSGRFEAVEQALERVPRAAGPRRFSPGTGAGSSRNTGTGRRRRGTTGRALGSSPEDLRLRYRSAGRSASAGTGTRPPGRHGRPRPRAGVPGAYARSTSAGRAK